MKVDVVYFGDEPTSEYMKALAPDSMYFESRLRKVDLMTQKLDAKFEGTIRKVKDGSIVPDDEYVVFLAKDDIFADLLPEYLKQTKERGCDAEQIAAVERMIERLKFWRRVNQDKCHILDAKGEKMLDVGVNP